MKKSFKRIKRHNFPKNFVPSNCDTGYDWICNNLLDISKKISKCRKLYEKSKRKILLYVFCSYKYHLKMQQCVTLRWHGIISQSTFIPWAISYLKNIKLIKKKKKYKIVKTMLQVEIHKFNLLSVGKNNLDWNFLNNFKRILSLFSLDWKCFIKLYNW